ncbi:MAG: UDP-N-acetylmuramate dehydrogenase [Alteromonadaceae bacterium]|jgi:UDP-N-acetylmuramate dehydrogenase
MKITHQLQLKSYNSFSVNSIASTVFHPQTYDDLVALPEQLSSPFYILGEGFNTLFVDELAPIIIKPNFKGIVVDENQDSYTVKIAANENWHDLVCYCVKHGIYGLENLALIPGSVGAAPVQNIGAYGVELSDYCSQVTWFEFSSQKLLKLSNQRCEFDYRESIFKNELKQKGLITEITLVLPKCWQAKLSYAGLRDLAQNTSALEVMNKVITLRQAKLPDPDILANAGSFFKNPTINKSQWQQLKTIYPDMPFYPQKDERIKLAAGWLIEHVGLKGYQLHGVGIHDKQALVLVNHHGSGQQIAELACYIQEKVFVCFDVWLEPEVRFVYRDGEKKLAVLNSRI